MNGAWINSVQDELLTNVLCSEDSIRRKLIAFSSTLRQAQGRLKESPEERSLVRRYSLQVKSQATDGRVVLATFIWLINSVSLLQINLHFKKVLDNIGLETILGLNRWQ